MGLWTKDGVIPDANDALLRMIGYTREELVAQKIRWTKLTPPEYAPLDQQAVAEVEMKGLCEPYEKEFVHKDGRRIPILIGGGSLQGNAEGGVFFVVDLTERKRAEEELRKSHAELQSHVEELGRFNRSAVGRELRMIELKKEINELCQRHGEPARYSLEFEEDGKDTHGETSETSQR